MQKNIKQPGVAATGGGPRRLVRIGGAALAVLLAIIIYLPARNMCFYFDDRITILLNDKIHALTIEDAVMENPFRSVANLTFMIQLAIHRPDLPEHPLRLEEARPNISLEPHPIFRRDYFHFTPPGGTAVPIATDPFRGLAFAVPPALPFRAANLLIHGINALLLILIANRLAPGRTRLAAIAALAFLVHPMATEPVNYITSRFDLMATGFSMAAILAHLAADEKPRRDALAVVFFIMALLCKETAAPLPLIVFLIDLARGRRDLRPLCLLAVSAIYVILRLQWRIELGPAGADVLPWYRYLILQQRVVWIYMANLVIPTGLNFERQAFEWPIFDWTFALINMAIGGGGGLAALRAWKSLPKATTKPRDIKTGRRPAALIWTAALGLSGWLSMAPASSVAPLHDVIREARAYPLLAILAPALIVGLFPWMLDSRKKASRVAAALLAVILVFLALGTYSRNLAWSSDYSLARDSADKSPTNPRAVYNYANALKWQARYQEAMIWFNRSYLLDPNKVEALGNIDAMRIMIEQNKVKQDLY